MSDKTGKVFLIGAGPGDPGLLTVKGANLIKNADVIIYDYLASPELLSLAGKNAQIIYVGKKGGDHTMAQEDINRLIVEKAKKGLTVARLKGGDPFIFGRGGEEAQVLEKQGISFEIVPGVTSAVAAPAYAGIPLTHRDCTSTLAFVTGHEDPTKPKSKIDWAALAKGMGTIVFLMGVKNLPHITEKLKNNGMAASTPVALVRWGTTPNQVTITGNLDNIVARVKQARLKAPAIIVVGKVVNLRDKLKWFENRPLFGKRIVVTRAREQASGLVRRLLSMGASCLECPTIKIVPPDDFTPLDNAIKELSSYKWIIFTSVNGVKFFFGRLFEKGLDARALCHIKTACIGPVTAEKLFEYGFKTDIIPESFHGESVVEAFENEDIKDKKILLPRAKQARPVLPVELKNMGAKVDEITVYKTVRDDTNAALLMDYLKKGEIDMVTFTSSSTAKNFASLFSDMDSMKRLMHGVKIASIGPITTATAKELGLDVHVTADEYTIKGLCHKILADL